ncbi:MAG: hypothetical protein CFE26_23965, partial [Verrucomicrobiales bacterium VVV1]
MKPTTRLACSALISLFAICPVWAEESEFTIGPDFVDAPETKVQPGVPKGKLVEFTMESKDSQIYKGIA